MLEIQGKLHVQVYVQPNVGHIGMVSDSYIFYVHVYASTLKHTLVVCIITAMMLGQVRKCDLYLVSKFPLIFTLS